jgi:hypothetical protein
MLVARLRDQRRDAPDVRAHRPDREIELCERDPQRLRHALLLSLRTGV